MAQDRARWLTLVLLTAWLLLGPIGMAFDSCAAMMALSLCDGGPCGVISAAVEAPPSVIRPAAVSIAITARFENPRTIVQSALEPPPKPVRLSA
jgi:hypothetical protein